jgi:hypothetical protein
MSNRLAEKLALIEALLELNDEVALQSPNSEDKESILKSSNYWRNSLSEFKREYPAKFRVSTVTEIINMFLVFWNESIGLDTERFWSLAKERRLNIKRRRSLRDVIKRGRFLSVHEPMSARGQWDELMSSNYLTQQFNDAEIEELQNIMNNDEIKRANLFKKCLRNNRLADSDALRYLDNMAYFGEHNIYADHFSDEEVERIHTIRREYNDKFMEQYNKNCGSQIASNATDNKS